MTLKDNPRVIVALRLSEIVALVMLTSFPGYLCYSMSRMELAGRIMFSILWTLAAMASFCVAVFCVAFRKKWPCASRFALSAFAGYVLSGAWAHYAKPTEQGVTQLIQSSIPIGSSRQRVITTLNAKRIFHQDFAGQIYANLPDRIITDGESAFLVYLDFNKQNRLKKISVLHWVESEDE